MSDLTQEQWFDLRTRPLRQNYRVRVYGNEFALPHLVSLFPDSDPKVTGEPGYFTIDWSGWEQGMTLSQIVELGNDFLTRIRGAARLCGLSTGPMHVWYLSLFDSDGHETNLLYPIQQIFLSDPSTRSEQRRRLASASINASITDSHIARTLEVLGAENDWASIRKTLEAMSATEEGKKGSLGDFSKQVGYDASKMGRLFNLASEGIHGYEPMKEARVSNDSLRDAEWELRVITDKWLTQKLGG